MQLAYQFEPTIVRIEDRFDSRLTEFRRRVCLENGADELYLNQSLDYASTKAYVQSREGAVFEEIWKYGEHKWARTEFDNLECVVEPDKIVQISGCRSYRGGEMLRVNMHLYLLQEYRARYRSLNFAENGIWARHIEYARSLPNCRCVFATIYAHNRSLEGLVRNLSSKRSRKGFDGVPYRYKFVDELEAYPDPIIFNEVPQYFFLYKLDPGFTFDGRAPQ